MTPKCIKLVAEVVTVVVKAELAYSSTAGDSEPGPKFTGLPFDLNIVSNH